MDMFSYDGPLMTVLRKVLNMILASFLFLLCCLPVITIGSSLSALYYAVEKNLKHDRGYVPSAFFGSIKENWKMTLPAGIVFLAVEALFYMACGLYESFLDAGKAIGYLSVVMIVFMILLGLYAVWVFAYIARIKGNLKTVLKNSSILMFGHLGTTLLVFLVIVLGCVGIFLIPPAVLILPSVMMWFITEVIEKVFTRHLSAAQIKEEEDRNRKFYN